MDNGPPPRAPASAASRLWTVARYGVALGLLWYLVSSGGLQWSALSGMFTKWWLTLAAFGLLGTVVVGTSWRFCILLAPRHLDITLPASIRLTMIGMFFNTVLPGAGGGDFVRFYYGARGHEGRRTEIVTVMLLDRVTGMYAMILWPLLAAPLFAPMWMGSVVLTGLLSAGLTVALGITAAFALAWSPVGTPGGWLERTVLRFPMGGQIWQIIGTIASYRAHRAPVILAIGISLAVHTLAFGAALLVASMVNPAGFSWSMSVLIPLGFMANTIPLTPGGLGVGEAAFDSLFGLAGLDGGAEVLLGWRLLMLVVGLAGLGVYLSAKKEFVQATGDA